jgi:hypothetical protein
MGQGEAYVSALASIACGNIWPFPGYRTEIAVL